MRTVLVESIDDEQCFKGRIRSNDDQLDKVYIHTALNNSGRVAAGSFLGVDFGRQLRQKFADGSAMTWKWRTLITERRKVVSNQIILTQSSAYKNF